MTGHKPFLLRAAAKDYLWGGSRLNDDFAKGTELSFECELLHRREMADEV